MKAENPVISSPELFALIESFTEEYNDEARENYISYIDFKHDNIGEYCFFVGLRDDLPPGLEIPREYKGFKVNIRVAGQI